MAGAVAGSPCTGPVQEAGVADDDAGNDTGTADEQATAPPAEGRNVSRNWEISRYIVV